MKYSCRKVTSLNTIIPKVVREYASGSEQIREFYNFPPNKDGYERMVSSIKNEAFPRDIVHKVLEKQHRGLSLPGVVEKYLQDFRNENTFTVCTGHQLQLFGGPLYFFHKIASVIQLAKKLSERHADLNIIPVFWLASEDHDKEEISSINFPGSRIHWDVPGGGPVGRLILPDPSPVIKQILDQLPDKRNRDEIEEKLKQAYQKGKTLAAATRDFIYAFLGEQSPLVLDPDEDALKALFVTEMKQELRENLSYSVVMESNRQLLEKSVIPTESSLQVQPRSTGIFYLGNGGRVRVEVSETGFKAGSKAWSNDELFRNLENSPADFSPDVLNRPLYQQKILPNLGYIGGPAEIKYWLQLKELFRRQDIPFPVLHPRNSFFFIEKWQRDILERLEISEDDLSMAPLELSRKRMEGNFPDTKEIFNKLKDISREFEEIAGRVDRTLIPSVAGHLTRAEKSLQALEKKIRNGIVRKEKERLGEYQSVYNSLFPHGNPQERVFNFLPWYSVLGTGFFDAIMGCCDPFDFTPVLVEFE